MATFTSQIIVGRKHMYDGGINNISHVLLLSENSVPAWVLKEVSIYDDEQESCGNNIIWLPTVEHMLEDALLMIGLYVLKNEELLDLAKRYFRKFPSKKIALYDDIESQHLQELYRETREIVSDHKIMLSVFHGSSISRQLPVLKHYENDIEVCTFTYKKELSPWTNSFEEHGELNEKML